MDPGDLVEQLFALQEGDLSYEELYEQHLLSRSHPPDLNSMTAADLASLHLLSDRQITALIRHREHTGPILSMYELQGLEGLTLPVIRLLNQLVRLQDGTAFGWRGVTARMASLPDAYVVTRAEGIVQPRLGYGERYGGFTIYRGAPFRQLTRFRSAHSRDFSFGFTAERDAGERFRWSPGTRSFGPDFLSTHLQLKEKGFIRNLVLGDYTVSFGQGLVLGGGFSTGKGAETITSIRRSASGFMPYTSIGESGFFRGAAVTFNLPSGFNLHIFHSRFWRDGNLRIRADSIEYIGSVFTSGYHRTPGELSRRKTWREVNSGGALVWSSGGTEAGVVLAKQDFSIPLLPAVNVYNQFNFRGRENLAASIHLNHNFRNLSFFSELASGNGDRAWIAGLLAALAPSLDVSISARNYGAGYHAFYSSALSENSRPAGEQGFYAGIRFKPDRKHLFTGYVDQFRFPWLRFRSYQPSSGTESLFRYTFTFARKGSVFVQYRTEQKMVNIPGDVSVFYRTAPSVRRNWSVNLDYRLADHVSGRLRLQGAAHTVAGQKLSGLFISHDLFVEGRRWRASGRYALFDVPDEAARLYAYERDVWMAYSFPAFSGTGVRSYVNVQYSLSRTIDVWLRWAVTNYTDRNQIGYGLEQINGPRRDEWKVQVRMKV
ncbi:MAG: hypothetical protein ACKO3B_12600 [Bacteroidota bacterium]